MNEIFNFRLWKKKFGCAFTGIAKGMVGQNSFYIHIPVALLVIGLTIFLGLDTGRICSLLICIAMVMAAELFNSSLEQLAKAITTETHPDIRDALDIASGAVLLIVLFAMLIGIIVLASVFF